KTFPVLLCPSDPSPGSDRRAGGGLVYLDPNPPRGSPNYPANRHALRTRERGGWAPPRGLNAVTHRPSSTPPVPHGQALGRRPPRCPRDHHPALRPPGPPHRGPRGAPPPGGGPPAALLPQRHAEPLRVPDPAAAASLPPLPRRGRLLRQLEGPERPLGPERSA